MSATAPALVAQRPALEAMARAQLPAELGARVVGRPDILSGDLVELQVARGITVADIVDQVIADEGLRHLAYVEIEGHPVAREYWSRVRPKPGRLVCVRAMPGELGGDSQILGLVIGIAFVAAAIFLPPLLPGAGIALFGSVTLGTVYSVAIGAVGLGVTAALANSGSDSLDQVSGTLGTGSRQAFIRGARNNLDPWGPVPSVYGKARMVPPLGAGTYSKFDAQQEQEFVVPVVWSKGHNIVRAEEIGETPIDEFDLTSEHRPGLATDAPLETYPGLVFEQPFDQLELTAAAGRIVRTTEENTDSVEIDVVFPFGLVRLGTKSSGETDYIRLYVNIRVEYSPAGQDTWTEVETRTFTSVSTDILRGQIAFNLPSPGQYDIGVTRATADFSGGEYFHESFWAALRALRKADPMPRPGFCKTVYTVKATGQLSFVEQITGEVSRLTRDYNGSAWVEGETSNPSSLAILAMKDNARPADDAHIDWPAFEAWHDFCRVNGFTYNRVHDFRRRVPDVLNDIFAAGRARRIIKDGSIWSVAIDEPRTVPAQFFTPENAGAWSWTITWKDLAHAWRIRFQDATAGGDQREIIVYAPGYGPVDDPPNNVVQARLFETLELPGITDPDLANYWGQWNHATRQLHRRRVSFQTDMQRIFCKELDLVEVTHRIMARGLGSGRIVDRAESGGTVTSVTLSHPQTMQAGLTYVLRWRLNDLSMHLETLVTTPGESAVLTFATPVPVATAPHIDALAAFGEAGLVTREMSVYSIEPLSWHEARITCLDYRPELYDVGTEPLPPYVPLLSRVPPVDKPRVQSVRSDGSVAVQTSNGTWRDRVAIGFAPPSGLQRLQGVSARYRRPGSPWRYATGVPISAGEIFLDQVERGELYEYQLAYIIDETRLGPWTDGRFETVIGRADRPPPPTAFTVATLSTGQRSFNIGLAPMPSNVRTGGGFRIRYGAQGGPLEDMVPLHDGLITLSPFVTSLPVAAGDYTFAAFTVDSDGDESASAIFVNTTLDTTDTAEVLFARNYAADGYPGSHDGVIDEGDLLAVETETQADLEPLTQAELESRQLALMNARAGSVTWEGPEEDLGFLASFTPSLTASGNGTVTREIRYGETPGLSGPYGPPSGVYRKRYFQVRVTSTDPSLPRLRSCAVVLDAQFREESQHDFDPANTSAVWWQRDGAGDYLIAALTLARIMDIRVTLQGLSSGRWGWSLVAKDELLNGYPAVRFSTYEQNTPRDADSLDVVMRGPRLL